jgi:hypothetical protein
MRYILFFIFFFKFLFAYYGYFTSKNSYLYYDHGWHKAFFKSSGCYNFSLIGTDCPEDGFGYNRCPVDPVLVNSSYCTCPGDMKYDNHKQSCVCPNGGHYSEEIGKCITDCPTQAEMENLAIKKCGSLNFIKQISCEVATAKITITCKTCSEIMQEQYDLCSQNNMKVINGLTCKTNSDGSNSVNFDKISLSNCVLPDSNNTNSDINNSDSNNNNANSDINNSDSNNNNTNSNNNDNTDLNNNTNSDNTLQNIYNQTYNIYNINKEIKQNLDNLNKNAIELGKTQKVGTLTIKTIKDNVKNLSESNNLNFEKIHKDLNNNGKKLDKITDTLKDSNKKLDKISDTLTDSNGTIKNGVLGSLDNAKKFIKIEKKEYVTGYTSDEFPTIKVNIFGKDIILLDDSYRNLIPFNIIRVILYVVAGVMAIIICIKTF